MFGLGPALASSFLPSLSTWQQMGIYPNAGEGEMEIFTLPYNSVAQEQGGPQHLFQVQDLS